jgi:hypothetical protein
MKQTLMGVAAGAAAVAGAQTVRFDNDMLGATPAGWTCGVTGRGSPHWSVQADPSHSRGQADSVTAFAEFGYGNVAR